MERRLELKVTVRTRVFDRNKKPIQPEETIIIPWPLECGQVTKDQKIRIGGSFGVVITECETAFDGTSVMVFASGRSVDLFSSAKLGLERLREQVRKIKSRMR